MPLAKCKPGIQREHAPEFALDFLADLCGPEQLSRGGLETGQHLCLRRKDDRLFSFNDKSDRWAARTGLWNFFRSGRGRQCCTPKERAVGDGKGAELVTAHQEKAISCKRKRLRRFTTLFLLIEGATEKAGDWHLVEGGGSAKTPLPGSFTIVLPPGQFACDGVDDMNRASVIEDHHGSAGPSDKNDFAIAGQLEGPAQVGLIEKKRRRAYLGGSLRRRSRRQEIRGGVDREDEAVREVYRRDLMKRRVFAESGDRFGGLGITAQSREDESAGPFRPEPRPGREILALSRGQQWQDLLKFYLTRSHQG